MRNERVEREAERNSSEDQKVGSTSLVMLKRRDSRVNVCAVCLDEVEMLRSSVQRIYKKKEIIKLPCSHIYHSDCLLPWLANNSHCPCCRTIVPSSFILWSLFYIDIYIFCVFVVFFFFKKKTLHLSVVGLY